MVEFAELLHSTLIPSSFSTCFNASVFYSRSWRLRWSSAYKQTTLNCHIWATACYSFEVHPRSEAAMNEYIPAIIRSCTCFVQMHPGTSNVSRLTVETQLCESWIEFSKFLIFNSVFQGFVTDEQQCAFLIPRRHRQDQLNIFFAFLTDSYRSLLPNTSTIYFY